MNEVLPIPSGIEERKLEYFDRLRLTVYGCPELPPISGVGFLYIRVVHGWSLLMDE